MPRALDAVTFDDGFVRALPADPSAAPGPRQVRGAGFSLVQPTPVRAPRILAWSDAAAELLGIERPAADDGVVAEVLGGNRVLPGMRPFAACYGGHQFGVWAGQLGDGRAISLTELIAPDGGHWEVQLKGAGPTPYSRTADGRAVLRSSIREFLCSEAMYHLGVPTTRALALVATGEQVMRDMFYDGRARAEPGAIVTRLAPTFVRFGTFELPMLRGDAGLLRALADHVIAVHYPELGPPSPAVYARWFGEICRRTAVMIAHWMRLGFVHGVMNTDNMSILGLTLDYGPYGWLDTYARDFTPNTTDAANGRYRFGNQPGIARWNLAHLARALTPLVDDQDALVAGLDLYRDTFERTYQAMMGEKLGITFVEGEDEPLLEELLAILEAEETDPTIFFRRLARVAVEAGELPDAALLVPLAPAFYGELPAAHVARVARWVRRYASRVDREPGDAAARRARMDRVNPAVILRNYLVQEAIDRAEAGDPSRIHELLAAATHPYDERSDDDPLLARRPDWARDKAGCSALSCSS